jgi:phosphatidylglycerophosphatase A
MPPFKETSDSLSHPVVEAPHIVVAPSRRTLGDYVAIGVATCGVGFIPLAPGTWGSAVGVLLYFGIGHAAQGYFDYVVTRGADLSPQIFQALLTTVLLLVIFVVSLAGTWAGTRAEKLLGKKDPGSVVVDEVAGQLVTFLFVPWDTRALALVAGFVAFRVFDIWKPYPVRRLEGLGGGLGIMADDLLAGFYAAALLSVINSIYLLL